MPTAKPLNERIPLFAHNNRDYVDFVRVWSDRWVWNDIDQHKGDRTKFETCFKNWVSGVFRDFNQDVLSVILVFELLDEVDPQGSDRINKVIDFLRDEFNMSLDNGYVFYFVTSHDGYHHGVVFYGYRFKILHQTFESKRPPDNRKIIKLYLSPTLAVVPDTPRLEQLNASRNDSHYTHLGESERGTLKMGIVSILLCTSSDQPKKSSSDLLHDTDCRRVNLPFNIILGPRNDDITNDYDPAALYKYGRLTLKSPKSPSRMYMMMRNNSSSSDLTYIIDKTNKNLGIDRFDGEFQFHPSFFGKKTDPKPTLVHDANQIGAPEVDDVIVKVCEDIQSIQTYISRRKYRIGGKIITGAGKATYQPCTYYGAALTDSNRTKRPTYDKAYVHMVHPNPTTDTSKKEKEIFYNGMNDDGDGLFYYPEDKPPLNVYSCVVSFEGVLQSVQEKEKDFRIMYMQSVIDTYIYKAADDRRIYPDFAYFLDDNEHDYNNGLFPLLLFPVYKTPGASPTTATETDVQIVVSSIPPLKRIHKATPTATAGRPFYVYDVELGDGEKMIAEQERMEEEKQRKAREDRERAEKERQKERKKSIIENAFGENMEILSKDLQLGLASLASLNPEIGNEKVSSKYIKAAYVAAASSETATEVQNARDNLKTVAATLLRAANEFYTLALDNCPDPATNTKFKEEKGLLPVQNRPMSYDEFKRTDCFIRFPNPTARTTFVNSMNRADECERVASVLYRQPEKDQMLKLLTNIYNAKIEWRGGVKEIPVDFASTDIFHPFSQEDNEHSHLVSNPLLLEKKCELKPEDEGSDAFQTRTYDKDKTEREYTRYDEITSRYKTTFQRLKKLLNDDSNQPNKEDVPYDPELLLKIIEKCGKRTSINYLLLTNLHYQFLQKEVAEKAAADPNGHKADTLRGYRDNFRRNYRDKAERLVKIFYNDFKQEDAPHPKVAFDALDFDY